MVRKVGGPPIQRTGSVEKSTPVQSSKVGGVSDVKGAKAQSEVKRVRRPTRPMTAAERDHLFKIIHEEADKLFGANGLPESQRHTLENAVKVTVDASIIEEEEDKKKE